MEERAKKIIDVCLKEKSKNPIEIFFKIAKMDFVRMHGPEHHILDGAAVLTAFYNAGGKIELEPCLNELMNRGLQMPGATCGMWGVCGAVSSMGAALSIIDGTGPLSTDSAWGKHMEFASKALKRLSEVGGPRCCKRDAFLSFQEAIEYINANYDVDLESGPARCCFSEKMSSASKVDAHFIRAQRKKWHLYVYIIHVGARLQRHWENIWRPMYSKAIRPVQKQNLKLTRMQCAL